MARYRGCQRDRANRVRALPVYNPGRAASVGGGRLFETRPDTGDLSLRTSACVTRVTMRGTRASGVDFVSQGATVHVEATREVILCGGVFNSPQLLMLSGIGPASHLRDMGIAPLVDLPVGATCAIT